ncbi:MAG TPA: hypothetical protein DCL04_06800 [Synergistaceae bacterium]|nr:hypothetical protein [Synergistaceae bacterium]
MKIAHLVLQPQTAIEDVAIDLLALVHPLLELLQLKRERIDGAKYRIEQPLLAFIGWRGTFEQAFEVGYGFS